MIGIIPKYKWLLIAAATLCLTCSFWLIENVLIRPFPFMDVVYTSKQEIFNAPPEKSPVRVQISTDLAADDFDRIWSVYGGNEATDLFDKIAIATRITRDLQQASTGNEIRERADIFSKDNRFRSVCSESSKIFVALMQHAGVPSRVIWMSGHTISEVWDDEFGWFVVDTYGNVIAKNNKEQVIGITEINQNFETAVFEPVIEDKKTQLPNYISSGYLSAPDNVYAQQSLFFVVDGAHLFSFSRDMKDPGKILHSIADFEPEKIGYGMQYVKPSFEPVGNVGINIYKRFTY